MLIIDGSNNPGNEYVEVVNDGGALEDMEIRITEACGVFTASKNCVFKLDADFQGTNSFTGPTYLCDPAAPFDTHCIIDLCDDTNYTLIPMGLGLKMSEESGAPTTILPHADTPTY